jgi:hypothetical protein
MLTADHIAGECTVVQDERASYPRAPHGLLALPLIAPGSGAHASRVNQALGCAHPRTPLFRADWDHSPATVERRIMGPKAHGDPQGGCSRALYHAPCAPFAAVHGNRGWSCERSAAFRGWKSQRLLTPNARLAILVTRGQYDADIVFTWRVRSRHYGRHDSGRRRARWAGSSWMGGRPYDLWRG